MKNMRKIASVLLALVMVFALAAPVFAAETYSITINNTNAGHTYEAYQIFTGDLSDGTLSNVEWGASVDNAEDLANAANIAERLDENYEGEETPLTLDNLLAMIDLGNAYKSTDTQKDGQYVIEGLEPGYYLVKDQAGSLQGEDDVYTEYLIKVVGPVVANTKGNVPQVEKKVQDTNDSTETDYTDWQDSADHDIGDTVPFQLTATLANNVENYTYYKIIFHDTLSAGLTYNEITKVTVDGKVITTGYEVATATNAKGETELTITFADVKLQGAKNNSVVVVEYEATLDDDAVIGSAGNPNVVYLEYSNNPNWNGSGEPGTPGTPDDDEPTGKTPEDVVIVFTYKVDINKTDSEGKPLTGAEFTLEKFDVTTGEWLAKTVVKNNEGTTFTFTGLDDGKYRLTETKTPAGYNSIDPIEFTVTAEHEIESDDPRLTSLTGNATTGQLTFTPVNETVTEGEETVTHTVGLSADVVNKAGVQLPETGGIGTTMFYIFGAVMVLGAAVLLVTKKRMSIAE